MTSPAISTILGSLCAVESFCAAASARGVWFVVELAGALDRGVAALGDGDCGARALGGLLTNGAGGFGAGVESLQDAASNKTARGNLFMRFMRQA